MTLQLKPNTFYRTRLGELAYVAGKCPFMPYPDLPWVGWINDECPIPETWGDEGGYLSRNTPHNNDLIAKVPTDEALREIEGKK